MLHVSITVIVVIVSQVFAYVQTHQIIYIKYVQFMVCKLYLNKAVKIILIQCASAILIQPIKNNIWGWGTVHSNLHALFLDPVKLRGDKKRQFLV